MARSAALPTDSTSRPAPLTVLQADSSEATKPAAMTMRKVALRFMGISFFNKALFFVFWGIGPLIYADQRKTLP